MIIFLLSNKLHYYTPIRNEHGRVDINSGLRVCLRVKPKDRRVAITPVAFWVWPQDIESVLAVDNFGLAKWIQNNLDFDLTDS